MIGQVPAVGDAATLDPRRGSIVVRHRGGPIGRPTARRKLPEFGQESTLSDTRLANQEGDPAMTGRDCTVQRSQRLQLALTPDHRTGQAGPLEAPPSIRDGLRRQHPVRVDGLGLALHHDLAEILDVERVGHEAMGAGRDQDGPGFRGGLHPCRDIHGVTEGGVLVAKVRSDVADNDRAAVDPGPDPEIEAMRGPQLPRELLGRDDHVERRVHGPVRVVLMGDRGAEKGEHRIALELGDRALIAEDGLRHSVEGFIHHRGPVLGIHPLRECRGADDVGEERGHRLALAGQFGRTHLLDERRRCCGGQAGLASRVGLRRLAERQSAARAESSVAGDRSLAARAGQWRGLDRHPTDIVAPTSPTSMCAPSVRALAAEAATPMRRSTLTRDASGPPAP